MEAIVMPFCPKCRAEYREGFSRCSDCEVDLVDELPPEEEEMVDEEPSDLVQLHVFAGDLYGEMVKEALENEGIWCVLRKAPGPTVLRVSGATEWAGTAVFVRRSELERSEEIMVGILDHI